jgi:cobalt-zinc-cadmium efflux system membrane fusion protein
VAAAHFKGACEESRFHSEKELVKARAHVDAAERALRVSHDTLRTLLGPYGAASQDECSSDFSLNAPIAGRIEELDTIAAVRFQVGERMIVLADTHSLWVAAQIHQRDWNVLQVDAGQLLKVAVPSLPELPLTAKVKFVGATVSPSTLTVPLVAEVSNPNDTLRPGMFVWVVVPAGPAHAALTVAAAAVQRQGEQSFVFVRDATHTYRRVEVELGGETPEWVEITRGVTAGDLVVDEGGFQLTSELLLEAEAEE